MNSIKVLLVADEYLALQLLDNFVKEVPDLEIIDKVKSLEGNQLEIDYHKIPVIRDRKNDIMNQIFK